MNLGKITNINKKYQLVSAEEPGDEENEPTQESELEEKELFNSIGDDDLDLEKVNSSSRSRRVVFLFLSLGSFCLIALALISAYAKSSERIALKPKDSVDGPSISTENSAVRYPSKQDKPNITEMLKTLESRLKTLESRYEDIYKHTKAVPVNKVEVEPIQHSSDISQVNKEGLEKLISENFQNRKATHIGKPSDGYVRINTHNNKVKKRKKNMDEFDKVRISYCGGITEEYLRAREKKQMNHSSTRWYGKPIDPASDQRLKYYHDKGKKVRRKNSDLAYLYHPNSIHYATHGIFGAHKLQSYRSFCQAPHPTLPDTMISIERVGPFTGNAGTDWSTVTGILDIADMAKHTKDSTIYIVGKFFAPVHRNGSIINYPPLHVHHAHIEPYHHEEKVKKISLDPQDAYQHHVLIQAHGDTVCKDEDGGTSCFLEQLEGNLGYRIYDSSAITGNFEINDVREAGSEPLEYYVDIGFIWTRKKKIETTFLQIGSPIMGKGWSTYLFPLDPHTNYAFWNYTNSFLGSGVLTNYLSHSHMSFVNSFYVFKGSNRIYDALEAHQFQKKHRTMPYIFECRNEDPEAAKNKILGIAIGAGGELICEATKPSLQLNCEQGSDTTNCRYSDKRIDFNCKPQTRLEVGEAIIVIAFNTVRNTSTIPLTRNSSIDRLAYVSTFREGYVGHQHSFFRADFVSDKAMSGKMKASTGDAHNDLRTGAYAPPALFYYGKWPEEQILLSYHEAYKRNHLDNMGNMDKSMKRKMVKQCALDINYKVELPWEKGTTAG